MYDRELWLTGTFFFVFSFFSSPLSFPLDAVIARFPTKNKPIVDLWHLIWLLGSMLILFFVIEPNPAWVLLPFLKFLDLIYVLMKMMVFPLKDRVWKVRPLLHLMLHYVQMVVVYACLFLFSQHMCGEALFLVHDHLCWLSAGDALYVSLITAATVGYGDIVPRIPSVVQDLCSFFYQPTLYVGLEILSAIALTVLYIPYVVSAATLNPELGSHGKSWFRRRFESQIRCRGRRG